MGASAFGAVDWGFISSLVKPMTVKLVFTGFFHYSVVDRWPATPKRACYIALIVFSRDRRINNATKPTNRSIFSTDISSKKLSYILGCGLSLDHSVGTL